MPDRVRGTWIREDRAGPLVVEVPLTGIYELRLSHFSFAGDIRLDWDIQ